MSAPERVARFAGVLTAPWSAEVVEIAALRGGTAVLARFGASRGEALPALGQVSLIPPRLILSVRPGRWLVVGPAEAAAGSPAARAEIWRQGAQGCAAVIDMSSAYAAFLLGGPPALEILARGCRIDLHPREFPPGSAAATVVAQVPVIIAALPFGMLLLTPSSTARHFQEWLEATAAHFGPPARLSVAELFSGEVAIPAR